jgi:hypothetical protein
MSCGLFFKASYTWSKSLDTTSDMYAVGAQDFYNLRADWGPSDYNVGQLFVFSTVYRLPVGSHQHYLSGSHGIVEAVLGNWNVAAIVSLHSGLPFTCLAGSDIANVGGGSQRCDEIGSPYVGTTLQHSPPQKLNPASFTTIPFTWGTESRNNLIGPSYKDIDFSVYKDFPLFERLKLQIRADFFNLPNHTNFANPVNNIQSSSFGEILGANSPREIQFAAKLNF